MKPQTKFSEILTEVCVLNTTEDNISISNAKFYMLLQPKQSKTIKSVRILHSSPKW